MTIIYQDDILALIVRNLSGTADLNDVELLKEWISNSSDNKNYFEQVKNIWEASDRQIDINLINSQDALIKVHKRIFPKFRKRTLWNYWQNIAAILIFPIAIGTLLWIYFNSYRPGYSNELVYNEIYAAFGTRSSLRLADSTLVWLNSGSSLRYPNKFSNKIREVYLKGEAYFEVKSDISRPFVVRTSALEVKATGTKFNIQEYDSNPLTEVTLVSGKVVVNELDHKNNPELITELKPDQHFTYNRETRDKSIINENSYLYIGWKDGTLIFRNERLDKVLSKLSMMFNVDIELQGEELQDYRYRATFQDESLEEIFKLLKLSSPINFVEIERRPLPDGSFPKKKVIIFPENQKLNIVPN